MISFSVFRKRMSKPERDEWQHFTQMWFDKSGKCVRVKCKYCSWEGSHHATRCAKHYRSQHSRDPAAWRDMDSDVTPGDSVSVVGDDSPSSQPSMASSAASTSTSSIGPPTKRRLSQASLLSFGDKSFSAHQQSQAEQPGHVLLKTCPGPGDSSCCNQNTGYH